MRVPLHISSDQLALEREMTEMGIARYNSNRAAAETKGRISTTEPGRRLLAHSLKKLSGLISDWIVNADANSGPRSGALDLLQAVNCDIVSSITIQVILDSAASFTLRSTTICRIATTLRDEAMLQALRTVHKPRFDELQSTKVPKPYRPSVAKKWLDEGLWAYEVPLRGDQVRAALICFTLALDSLDLIRVDTEYRTRHVVATVRLTEDARIWIERSHEAHVALSPMYLPMVDEPRDWAPGEAGGYRSNLARRKPLCRVQRPRHIQSLRDADMPSVYQAVNLAQRTRWRVAKDVFLVAKELWDTDSNIAGIPNREAPVFSPRPKEEDFPSLEEYTPVAKAWKAHKTDTLIEYRDEMSSRMRHARTLGMADKFAGKAFYMPHFVDFRGRMYPVPPWLTHQGPDLARGLLQFDRYSSVEHGSPAAELFEEAGVGLWKGDIPEGLPEAVCSDPLDCTAWADADKPWQFLAWCLDVVPWRRDEGHPVRTPIHADGSNNGLQIYSLLMRDPGLAARTNVSGGDKEDLYMAVADKVWARVLADPSEMARQWRAFLPKGLPREATKRPVMTWPYGVRKHSGLKYFREWLLKLQRERGVAPWGVSTFGPCRYLVDILWEEISGLIQPAIVCMDWLRAVADAAYPNAVSWFSPAGFPIQQDYPKTEGGKVKSVILGKIRSVRYGKDQDSTSKSDQRDGLPPNYVHSLDAAAMMLTMCKASSLGIQDFAMVHDSFGCPAGDAPAMALALRQTFAEMFSDNLLENFVKEVRLASPDSDIPDPPKVGALDPSVVLDSKHFFS